VLDIGEQLHRYGVAIEAELLHQEDLGNARRDSHASAWSNATAPHADRRIVRRSRWVTAVAAAAVVLALVVAIGILTRATNSPGPAAGVERLVEGTWTKLPVSPLGDLGRAQVFSTGRGILVWGEYSSADKPAGFHGAIFQPATNAWHRIADAPVTLTQEGEWTGRVLLFPRAQLSYDVQADRWRAIEPAPFVPDSSALYTWNGSDLVVVSPQCGTLDTPACTGSPTSVVAAYSPSKDRWRTLPAPAPGPTWTALASSPDGLVLWGRWPTAAQGSESQLYDFTRGSWMSAIQPPPDTGQSAATTVVSTRSAPVWLGWYTVRGLDGEMRAARLDGESWRALRPLPHPSICGVHGIAGPRGTVIVSCSSTETLLLDIARDRWSELPRAPRGVQAASWTGRSLYALSNHGRLMMLR
jgi:hypothetical protein